MNEYTEGQRVRLTRDMEELTAGMVGTVRLASNSGATTDGVEFDGGEGISINRRIDGQTYRVIDHCEALADNTVAELRRLIAECSPVPTWPTPSYSGLRAVDTWLTAHENPPLHPIYVHGPDFARLAQQLADEVEALRARVAELEGGKP